MASLQQEGAISSQTISDMISLGEPDSHSPTPIGLCHLSCWACPVFFPTPLKTKHLLCGFQGYRLNAVDTFQVSVNVGFLEIIHLNYEINYWLCSCSVPDRKPPDQFGGIGDWIMKFSYGIKKNKFSSSLQHISSDLCPFSH